MLLRNSLWNLAGSAFPALVALATVPLLIRGLGLEGFGIVTLIGSVIGYFGVLDINLSAGSIKYLAQFHAQGELRKFAETFWFGCLFYGLLGVLGAVALFNGAAFLTERFFTVSAALREETLLAFQIAAFGFAMSQIQNYLLVIPQALQRYDRSAQAEAFFGVLVNLVSAAVALNGSGMAAVIGVRVAIAALNNLWLIWLLHKLGVPLQPVWPRSEIRQTLTTFSAYAYLSRLAALMQAHGDKLIVGTLAGPVALTFYTVPSQLAGRILGLCFRLASVIYPRVAALAATGQQASLRMLYLDSTRLLTYLNLIVLGMIALAGEEFLRRWVGAAFVAEGYPVLLLVTLALLVDSLTNIPSLVIDGLGHPRITGRFALARGLIGIAMVLGGTLAGGIIGAAAAHLLASLLMTVLFLTYVHGRTVPVSLSETLRLSWLPSIVIGSVGLALLLPLKWLLPAGVTSTLLLMTFSLVALLVAGFVFIVSTDERHALLSFLRKFARKFVRKLAPGG